MKMKIFNTIISAVYPNKCISCGEIIKEEKTLCDLCEKNIERNNLDDICLKCGFENDNCVCASNVYRFDKLISVFKNENIAQRAYYNYKFNKRQHYAGFFANEMSNAVRHLYSDIDFDIICTVPSGRNFINNTHYNHCGYMAKIMSKNLNIPYTDNILYCRKHGKLQHKSTIKERLTNVNGKYGFKVRIDGKKVLLVDDIRTTGATLDECAKMLLYAGAYEVCCVTVLSAVIKSKKEN